MTRRTGRAEHPDASAEAVDAQAAGLSESEAAERLRRDGRNLVPTLGPPAWWRQLAAQMIGFFALLLWVAGLLALVAGLPQLGIAIFVVVIVNGLFAFSQEYRADRAAERLRDLLPRRVLVVRDGHIREIDTAELVVGDHLILQAGDRVPADLRAGDVHSVSVDTSMLTGESVPQRLETGDAMYAGTFVVEGEATAIVETTGASTRLAEIASLTEPGPRRPGPLEAELHRVVRTVATIAVGVGSSFFLITLLVDIPPSDGFIFAIGVTVALVPEGLLPTVTLSLALGAQRMSERHALVRRLEAVETLGSTTFICTDKTGTLTRNEMNVVEIWTPAGSVRIAGEGYGPNAEIDPETADALTAAREAALTARRCSTGRAVEEGGRWTAHGDPMEAAVDALARRLTIDVAADLRAAPDVARFPFDPRRRRTSVVTETTVLVKGAPDSVLAGCSPEAGATVALDDLARRGLRVLAVARRRLEPGARSPSSAEEAESALELVALLGFEDPPRGGARDAIGACRRAGIAVAMVTGDHSETALAIARQVGLHRPGAPVVTGAELPASAAMLGALLDHDGVVVARATPEDKLRIAGALQERGHIVAMTGDGVNDGPALRQADIGVAMGRFGSDVAREAADLVLLDDDFSTIVVAVEHGRATYGNMRRFLTYHLSDNVAELTPLLVWAFSGTRFPLALGVLQILALDLATDTFSAVALGAEPPDHRSLSRSPARGSLLDRTVARRAFGILGPVEGLFGILAFVASLAAGGWAPGANFPTGAALLTASGATFAAVVVGQSANAFACRSSTLRPDRLGWGGNRILSVAVAVELFLAVLLLGVPPVARALDHAWPSLVGLGVALLTAPAVLVADAVDKAIRRGKRGD